MSFLSEGRSASEENLVKVFRIALSRLLSFSTSEYILDVIEKGNLVRLFLNVLIVRITVLLCMYINSLHICQNSIGIILTESAVSLLLITSGVNLV